MFTAISLTPRFSGVLAAVKRQNRFSILPVHKKPAEAVENAGLGGTPR